MQNRSVSPAEGRWTAEGFGGASVPQTEAGLVGGVRPRRNPPLPPRAQSLMFSILVDKSGKHVNNHENPFAVLVIFWQLRHFVIKLGRFWSQKSIQIAENAVRGRCGMGLCDMVRVQGVGPQPYPNPGGNLGSHLGHDRHPKSSQQALSSKKITHIA